MTKFDPTVVEECMAIVRERSVDRYLATLFLPAEIRAPVFVLYAFDAEIAHVRDLIREPMMGEIRLQWWLDVIEGKRAAEAQNHRLAAQLLKVIENYQLQRPLITGYLEARTFDFYDVPVFDIGSLEKYVGHMRTAMLRLAATIANQGIEPDVETDISAAGIAIFLVELLKSLPLHRSRHQCFIPEEILAENGVTMDSYLRGAQNKSAQKLVRALTGLAGRYLCNCSSHFLSEPARTIFLPLALVPGYLKRLDRMGAKVLVEPVDFPQWRKQIVLWQAARRGTY